jgi:hypothetical protein
MLKRNQIFFTLFSIILLFSCAQEGEDLIIVDEGDSAYKIIIPKNATVHESKAAELLSVHIERMSGVKLETLFDVIAESKNEINIGNTNRNPVVKDSDGLGTDGYRMFTAGTNLVIQGGSERGVLYGVIDLIEELGTRKITVNSSISTGYETLVVSARDTSYIPPFEYREVYYHGCYDEEFAEWHKLDNANEARQNWGSRVHTFSKLVPPGEFFSSNPEYFSLVQNKRVANGQLCLTNEEVFNVLVENLKKEMAKSTAEYWSVSQNDNQYFCSCANCSASDQAGGSPAATLLNFVNRVAAEFPNKVISTLAYQYTRKPPTNVKPADNVNIMLCSIECNRSQAIANDPLSKSFREDVEGWTALTDDIIMWDYVVQFTNLLGPFPNLKVLQPNIKYFRDQGIKMMFQQGNIQKGGELGNLRPYLIAKLLWNPDANVDEIISEYCSNYYGPAGEYIVKYINAITKNMNATDDVLNIFGSPIDPVKSYLDYDKMDEYNYYFNQAISVVQNDPELRDRVQLARMPITYTALQQARALGTQHRGFFGRINEKFLVVSGMRTLAENFYSELERFGIARLSEHGITPTEYITGLRKYMERLPEYHIGYRDPISGTPAEQKYNGGMLGTLLDGLRGTTQFKYDWVGFEKNDMEVIIDLEEISQVNSVSIGFLQSESNWVWMPKSISFEISQDGASYLPGGTIVSNVNPSQSGSFIRDFSSRIGKRIRYIKVKAENMGVCPEWHHGAGGPAWIMADEIIIN